MASLTLQPQVVIFDFNGTLFDDLHVAFGSVQAIFCVYGIPCPTLEQYREEITANYMEFYYNHGIPRTTIGDDLNTIRNRFYQTNGQNARIRPDVWDVLYRLSTLCIHVAIVSAESSTNLYRQLIRHGNIQRCFDFIRPEAWGECGKEKAFLEVAEVFGKDPREMIYVDDSVDGLISARDVEVTPVAFTNPTGYNSERRLVQVAEFSIQEIEELNYLINIERGLP